MTRAIPLEPIVTTTPIECLIARKSFPMSCTVELDDGRTFVLPVPLPPGFRIPAEIRQLLPVWMRP
jgi:hypothetical protein